MDEISEAEFLASVLERSSDVPVVVDFWAPWCGPCRVIGPVLERLEAEAGGEWVLVKVNVDAAPGLSQRYRIQSIPAVKAFKDGAVAAEFVGALPEAQIRSFLAGVVPTKGERRAQAGRSALAAGDMEAAEAAFLDALKEDPNQPDALLFVAERALTRGDAAMASAWLQRLSLRDQQRAAAGVGQLKFRLEALQLTDAPREEEPAVAEDYRAGVIAAAAGAWEEALARFFAVVKQDRRFQDDAGRKAMLQVFDCVGLRSPLADAWRQELSMELYK